MGEIIEPKNLAIYLVAMIMGGGGSYLHDYLSPPRPDPYTGTEGRSLAAAVQRLEDRVGALEINVAVINSHLEMIEDRLKKKP